MKSRLRHPAILAMPEGPLKELEVLHYGYEKMFRTVAFFLKVDPASLSESNYIDEIARIYYSSAAVLLEQEKEITLEKEIIWNDEIWVISAPELAQGSPMTFGEFIDAKQMVSQMVKLGHSQWEYMLPLCAIYLRKKGEAYSKELLYEGSERQQLMRSLPMSIALQVGFFLTGTLNISINILKSLIGTHRLAFITIAIRNQNERGECRIRRHSPLSFSQA